MATVTLLVLGMHALRLDQAGVRYALGISGGPETGIVASQPVTYDQDVPNQSAVPLSASGFLGTLMGWQETGEATSSNEASAEFSANAITAYDAQGGDTVSSVALKFGISENTVRWVNNLKSDDLAAGQHLLILPLSGTLHTVKTGQTLESIAGMYNVAMSRIQAANHLAGSEDVFSGEQLIIPGGDVKQTVSFALATTTSSGTRATTFFKIPTTGWNWGKLHDQNAVDIANTCGTPVYASASGFVTSALADGWNDGYGSYIRIDDGNGIETTYAHLSALFVSAGAYVNAGDMIGAIGNTGRVDGITGCHLHFEVFGAPNPFAKS